MYLCRVGVVADEGVGYPSILGDEVGPASQERGHGCGWVQGGVKPVESVKQS